MVQKSDAEACDAGGESDSRILPIKQVYAWLKHVFTLCLQESASFCCIFIVQEPGCCSQQILLLHATQTKHNELGL